MDRGERPGLRQRERRPHGLGREGRPVSGGRHTQAVARPREIREMRGSSLVELLVHGIAKLLQRWNGHALRQRGARRAVRGGVCASTDRVHREAFVDGRPRTRQASDTRRACKALVLPPCLHAAVVGVFHGNRGHRKPAGAAQESLDASHTGRLVVSVLPTRPSVGPKAVRMVPHTLTRGRPDLSLVVRQYVKLKPRCPPPRPGKTAAARDRAYGRQIFPCRLVRDVRRPMHRLIGLERAVARDAVRCASPHARCVQPERIQRGSALLNAPYPVVVWAAACAQLHRVVLGRPGQNRVAERDSALPSHAL